MMKPQRLDELLGQTLGQRYRLDRPIGAGGMGAVFEATQLDLARTVAVKVLLDVDPRGIARLRQEALTAGSLSCPHVVSIFDFQAPPNEPPFIVMELLPGHSLAQLLRREPLLAVPRATRIAAQMLVGLEAAHSAHVVHRDVKPSNTWLVFGPGVEEHVKLLDFGIAKMLDNAAALLTTTGSVLGTPAYLAPEQLRGLPIDARVDIHAMGVVLFEMLAGYRPWQAQGPSFYVEILERIPPLLHEVAPHVPPALSQIVARALAKDPAARFSRAADMRAALEPFVGRPSLQPSMVVGSLSPPSHGQPPSPASTAQGTTAGSGVASTLGMVPPTVDYAPPTGPHVAQAYGVPPPTLGPGPYAPPPSRRAALPFFLLGGLVAALLAGVVVVAFVLVHDRGAAAATENVSPSAAPAAKATGATSAIVAAAGTPTAIDAGTAGRRATGPVVSTGAVRAGASAPVGASPISQRCACETTSGQPICTTPKVPNCACLSRGDGLCPEALPNINAVCPVRPDGLRPYSAAGRKNGEACQGFLKTSVGTASGGREFRSFSAQGQTECTFCYGNDKFAAVEGTACKGIVANGESVEGKVVCSK